jgi:peptidyl-prolyl cis-trans isomerase C
MATVAPTAGCSIKPAISTKPKTVSVNGIEISRAAIARETQNHPAAKPIEAWQAAARALVIRELLLQEARRLALVPAPLRDDDGRRETDDEALIRQVLEQEAPTPEPGEDECRRYFERNAARFQTPDLYEVSHILLPQGENQQRLAEAILSSLQAEPSAFAALAVQHSACPSREVGGSLGQIGPGQTVREFEEVLPTLPLGAVAPAPVRTRYGLHIVRVDRRVAGRALPFEIVHDRIAAFLRDRVRHMAERQYLAILAGRAAITGVALETAPSPLVQ